MLAYRELFDGFKLAPGFRVTSEVSAVLLGRMYGRRQLLAVLGLVPAKWAGDRFGMPSGKAGVFAVNDLFDRMGLKLRRREGTATHVSPSFPLDLTRGKVGDPVRTHWHELTTDSWSRTAELAARRNSRRVLDAVPRESADARYWHEVRREIMARAMSADEAARLILTKCRAQQDGSNQWDNKGRTYGARVAAAWLRWVYAPEWRRRAA